MEDPGHVLAELFSFFRVALVLKGLGCFLSFLDEFDIGDFFVGDGELGTFVKDGNGFRGKLGFLELEDGVVNS